MTSKIWSLALLLCATVPFAYTYSKVSVKSHIFESLRPKHPPKNITECDTVVTEPYGLLQKTYKRGEVKGSSCSWTLRAPANHVVNVISVGWDLTDETSSEKHRDDYSGSHIDLYDSDQKYLTGFAANTYQHVSEVFVQSISSGQEMLVKITYEDSVDYATQHISIKYEFLNVDDMKRLLRARPRGN